MNILLVRNLARSAKIISFLSAVGSVILLGIPKITINASFNPDPESAFGTYFTVKNEGHVPVLIDEFVCKVSAELGIMKVRDIENFEAINRWVFPGTTITRSCGAQFSFVPEKFGADVKVKYFIFLQLFPSKQEVHFTGVSGKSGHFLVPDLKD